ncbi:MAG TPA: DNA helicase II [Gammaproteobacteria bacterium]|jgi:DNA helicase-2/ATP-dependent DNA helicase PcrA|nr:DNA helicase II [Gammaproteobacteria bacterium]
MDVTAILDQLNPPQREAVSAEAKPTLVLAGAGSGKTRVLVHRIAWLLQVENISPFGILAVTFTNKAAGEMRARVERLMGGSAAGMWIGTFHSIAHRLLRQHWREAGLPQAFQILDSEDQYRLIRRVLKSLELDESRYPPRQAQWFINSRKDDGLRAKNIPDSDDPVQHSLLRVYRAYEEACERGGMVDFAELLLRSHELWLKNPGLLEHYRRRFRHILVDEFQDTNAIQYASVRMLTGESGVPFVVGDDDQSIYGWRGAKIENILRFEKDFPGTRVIRLEQNYRSTGNILKAANALISHNSTRLGKNLWTAGSDGAPIHIYAAYNEQDEAQFIIERIKHWQDTGGTRSEVAVLYRSNAQSRVFEERLMLEGIPYRVYGGLRFFERQEIKDALAYLKLMENRNDDSSFERVINVPTRGIGTRSVELLRERAKRDSLSLWQALEAIVAEKQQPARVSGAFEKFAKLMHNIDLGARGLQLYEQVDQALHGSGLVEFYKAEKGERGEARVENLEELVNAARSFVLEEAEGTTALSSFLSHAALEAGEGQAEAWEDCVQLMTLHSAKGLEFPLVFICGMEDGLFPHERSSDDLEGLEEERRLCYVGMTRAMQELFMSYAEQRRLHGMDNYGVPSRFLRELPAELVEEIRPRVQVSRPYTATALGGMAPTGFSLGQRVRHPTFGEGVVLDYEGDGSHARVQVNFKSAGSKWLVVAYANLSPV